MRTGRSTLVVTLTDEEQQRLTSLAHRSRRAPHEGLHPGHRQAPPRPWQPGALLAGKAVGEAAARHATTER